MIDWSFETRIVVMAVVMTVATLAVVWRSFRVGSVFTASIGLHLNMLLLFGVGPFCYVTNGSPVPEPRPRYDLIGHMADAGQYVLAGYLAWCLFEFVRPLRKRESYSSEAASLTPTQIACVVAVGLVGYFMSGGDLAASGLGTIFPVARTLLYPTVVIALLRVRGADPATVLFAVPYYVLTLVLSVLSPWRSELIALLFGTLMVVIYRARRWAPAVAAAGVGLVFVFIPYVDMKKTDPERMRADPVGAFVEVLGQPLGDRTDIVMAFLSIRTNGLRELAFVNDGLARGVITHRGGETYLEAALQIIPRVVWPDKPSFNQTSNGTLPRQIGLVGEFDEVTSWGVHMYAEFGWNFPNWMLVGFVPVVFAVARGLDVLCRRLYTTPAARLLASLILFFLALFVVGLVNVTTYVLWGLLLVKVFDLPGWGATPSRQP